MIRFLLKRLAWGVATIWVVYTISFILMREVPGGPFSGERSNDPAIQRNLERRYHTDEPLWKQYSRELWNDLHFDFGYSQRRADFTVAEIIKQGFPISATLGLLALLFALALGVTAGVVSAARRGTVIDFALMLSATVGIAVPSFVTGGVLVLLLVFAWQLLPAAGWGSVNQLILPVFCLGLPFAADIARLTRTGVLDVLGQDYIRTARAKGLSPTTVLFRHALQGGILPLISFLGPATADILSGSMVVEKIFAIPGLGTHFVESALQRDYTLAAGLLLLYTALLYGFNLLVDLVHTVIDPRVKVDS